MLIQEAYETMRGWLTRSGASRAYDGIVCRYEMDNGNRCIVGAILSPAALDEITDLRAGVESIIGSVIHDDTVRFQRPGTVHWSSQPIYQLAYSELLDIPRDFLQEAQIVHDNKANWDEYGFTTEALTQLDELAKRYGCITVTEKAAEAPKVEEHELVTVG